MRTLVLFFVMGLCIVKTSTAQSHDLMVQSESGKLYLVHAVAPKENWYSIGRLYNVSPKEIAPFNGTTIDKPLAIGEHLKIPLTTSNFSQDGLKATDETFVPVYHSVQDKEALARISAAHNNVPLANLEKWNHITKDQAKTGMHLIIGYLKVKPALSALASGGKDRIAVAAITETKKEENNPANTSVADDNTKKTEPVVKKMPPAVVKQDPKTTSPPVTQNKPPVSNTRVVSHSTGSYFSSEYNEGGKALNGTAGIFKSTSGWQDGKYYALVNNVAVGTIVKVSIPATNKIIYAKVLGPLPDMKESAGLAIRISNAAAHELGEGEDSFGVEVRY